MNKLYNAPYIVRFLNGNDHVIAKTRIYNVLCDSSDSGAIYSGREHDKTGNRDYENVFMDLKTRQATDSYTEFILMTAWSGISMRKTALKIFRERVFS